MKCAIVQFEAVHEEIIPSIVSAFAKAGVQSTAFINAECRTQRGDIFEAVGTQGAEVNYVPIERRADWQNLAEQIRQGQFEFVFLATFQRESVANWAANLDARLFGMVHNVDMFRKTEPAVKLFKSGRIKLLTLAPHVASFACRHLPPRLMDSIGVLQSVQWGQPPDRGSAPGKDRPIRLAVPGGVKFATRDYLPLIDALSKVSARPGGAELRIDVIGGGADREELMQRAADAGLKRQIHFAPLLPSKRVGYADYVAHLREADFLLPLNPPNFTPYHTHKITSAVPTSIGMCLPPVLDRWTSFTYRTPGLVADLSPESVLQRVLNCETGEYLGLAAELKALRNETLARNAGEIGRLMGQN